LNFRHFRSLALDESEETSALKRDFVVGAAW
jgi:hypothetical protein